MANRPAFVPLPHPPYVQSIIVDFEWFPGLSKSQKQRSVRSLHRSAISNYSLVGPLEISSKSLQDIGVALSAFNLQMRLPLDAKSTVVECVYQASKVFQYGGPFLDLVNAHPRDAKRDLRLQKSGELVGFLWQDLLCPLEPKTTFYDWIYLRALGENPGLASRLIHYGFFTDIEFNPTRSVNCQAHSAALYVGLINAGICPSEIDSFDKLLSVLNIDDSHVQHWSQGRFDF